MGCQSKRDQNSHLLMPINYQQSDQLKSSKGFVVSSHLSLTLTDDYLHRMLSISSSREHLWRGRGAGVSSQYQGGGQCCATIPPPPSSNHNDVILKLINKVLKQSFCLCVYMDRLTTPLCTSHYRNDTIAYRNHQNSHHIRPGDHNPTQTTK